MLKSFVKSILQKHSNLRPEFHSILLSPVAMTIYKDAFTHSSIDSENNLEVYEQLGDVSINKFLVWYCYERFPELRNPQGVKKVARIRINSVGTANFSKLATGLGFLPHIMATKESFEEEGELKILEDVFEAFFGATEYILDTQVRHGVGYTVIYGILSSIFNETHISLDYESLFDAKTRLKEFFDRNKDLGITKYDTVQYKRDIENPDDVSYWTSTVYLLPSGGKGRVKLGYGKERLKAQASEVASEEALKKLVEMGYDIKKPERVRVV